MPMCRDEESAGGAGALLDVKAVPGAKRDEVAGVLGERLKVRVAAAPENGKANRAICELLAGVLGVKARAVEVVRGHGSAEKTVRVAGMGATEVVRRLTGGAA